MSPKISSDEDGDIAPCSVMHSYRHAKEWDDWKQEKYGGAQKAESAVEQFKEKWAKDVVYFQLQVKGPFTAQECIWKIDSDAPVPSPLEGGDGNGPLYLCIFDAKLVPLLYAAKYQLIFKVYTQPTQFWMKEIYYKNTYHVRWRIQGIPGVSLERYTNDVIEIAMGESARQEKKGVAAVVTQKSCWPWKFLRRFCICLKN
jgi:hypothetical protein